MSYSPYRLFLQNLRKHRFYYGLGTAAMLITSLSEVMLPKFIQWSLDLLTGQNTPAHLPSIFIQESKGETLNRLILGLVVILLIGWLGRVGWRQILARQTHLAGHDIKTRMWSVLKDQPLALFDRFTLGDLMNRATADWNKTRFIHGFTIVLTFDLIFFSLLAVGSMLMIDVQLTLLSLLMIPFLPRRIVRISREEYRLHEHAQEQLSSLSELISQAVKTTRLQRATASERIWLDKLGEDAELYAKRQFQVLKTSWKIFILGALPTIFAYAVLFTFGIYKIQSGAITIGGFIALQSYVLLLQSPLFELGSVISEWQTGFASYKRITQLYDLERQPQVTDPGLIQRLHDPEVAVRIQKLSYSYDGQRPALQDVSLLVRRGEKVGLMGPIGSGKSTLISILAGLLEDPTAPVFLHGIPLAAAHRDWFTAQVTLVPQKPFLFAGTIRDNLILGSSADEASLLAALHTVDLLEDLANLPEGLDSWIGEAGINLSGGQKQRLALARALLKPAPILLLDDALSAVDSVTESRILLRLSSYLQDQTVIWTAHRPSTLQLCDPVFQMDHGRLSLYTRANDRNRSLPVCPPLVDVNPGPAFVQEV